METPKRTPVVEVGGTRFLVDVFRQELREIENPGNSIAFADMRDKGHCYVFTYDPETRNLPSIMAMRSDHLKRVSIPQMVALDPDGVAEKYGIKFSDLDGKTDFDLIVDPQILKERGEGRLPRINIALDDFIIDIRINELRLEKEPERSIQLQQMQLSDDGQQHEGYYNTVERRLVVLDPALTDFPDHVVKITLPNILRLDPVGVCDLYSIEQKEFLRRYPPQKGLRADVIPLAETGVPAMIRVNRERMQQENTDNRTRIGKGQNYHE